MFRSILIALLALLITLPETMAANLIVHNQCQFAMWCGSAANDGTFTPTVQVYPGGYYTSPQPALAGGKGVVVKCGHESNILEPYQLEVAQDADTRTWLDLSDLNGRPYQGYHRRAEIAGTAHQV
ncbi:hypothetical protein CHU98_g9901 [Xylaria longipes]|nr:hypothetical protein CHU98_g9901 [Xylaria longipes]